MHGHSARREMSGIFTSSAADVKNSVAWPEERIDVAPYQAALGAAHRSGGPQLIVMGGYTVKDSGGIHASTSP
jgi:hypothetical protein